MCSDLTEQLLHLFGRLYSMWSVNYTRPCIWRHRTKQNVIQPKLLYYLLEENCCGRKHLLRIGIAFLGLIAGGETIKS